MLKNYIKIALRNLWKDKLFSVINIISLSIGLSAAFVIGLMVYYDFTFDKFHEDDDRIYRIVTRRESPSRIFHIAGTSTAFPDVVREKFSTVEQLTYFNIWNPEKVSQWRSNRVFKNPEFVVFTDTTYFNLFEYEWLAGSSSIALTSPAQVVLSQKRAKRYFPESKPEDVIGKVLVYNDSVQATVTGVVANFENRTDLVFEEFISLPTALKTGQVQQLQSKTWNQLSSSDQVFIKLKGNTDDKVVEQQLNDLYNASTSPNALWGVIYIKLQALSDIHFNPDYSIFPFSDKTASKPVLKSLILIAIFLLSLGCFNFINLKTAQASQRAKEIGVRKTLGGSRRQLIAQFLVETFLLTSCAAILSIFFSMWLFDIFKDFFPKGFSVEIFLSPVFIAASILFVILMVFASGVYPGFVLSRFKPVAVLKGGEVKLESKGSLRKAITVFQFSIAQIFVISTLLVIKQINFLMSEDMGFEKEAIAYVTTPDDEYTLGKKQVLYNKLSAIPEIENLSIGGMPPASTSSMGTTANFKDKAVELDIGVELLYGGTNYLDFYGIELLAGRTILNDTIAEYVINEELMHALGFNNPKDVLDKSFSKPDKMIPIVGVMRDFNQHSLEVGIKPMIFTGDPLRKYYSQFRNIHFKLPKDKTGNSIAVLDKVSKAYQEIYPNDGVEIHFVDEDIAKFYDQEKRISKLLNWATGLAVLISCLGLLGLVIHTTSRRTKEIGIRKVLGASILQINALLCTDFLKLVIIAYVIALPIAWWGLQHWLEDYAYKTEMSWWVFALSGLGMMLLAVLIVSFKTLKAAIANPVKALRTE